MAAPVLRPLSVGEVLDVSFGLYRAAFVPLLVVALVCRAIPTIIQIYLNASGGFTEHWMLALANMVASAVLATLGVAASTFIVSGAYLGQDVTAESALRQAVAYIWPLFVLALMTGLVVIVGFLLLIVPGFIALAGLALATVALVLEHPLRATDAMSRSWELSKGYRGKILVTMLVSYLLLLIPTMIVGVLAAVLTLFGGSSQIVTGVIAGVLTVFVYPFLYVVLTVLYYDLRVRKEGFDLELLATATQPT